MLKFLIKKLRRPQAEPLKRPDFAYSLFLRDSFRPDDPYCTRATLSGLAECIFASSPELKAVAIGHSMGVVNVLSFNWRLSEEARRNVDDVRPIGLLITFNPA